MQVMSMKENMPTSRALEARVGFSGGLVIIQMKEGPLYTILIMLVCQLQYTLRITGGKY